MKIDGKLSYIKNTNNYTDTLNQTFSSKELNSKLNLGSVKCNFSKKCK